MTEVNSEAHSPARDSYLETLSRLDQESTYRATDSSTATRLVASHKMNKIALTNHFLFLDFYRKMKKSNISPKPKQSVAFKRRGGQLTSITKSRKQSMVVSDELKLLTTENLEQISQTIDELEKQIDKTNTLLTNMRPREENIKVTTDFRVQNPRKLRYSFEPQRQLFSKKFGSKRINTEFDQVRSKNRASFIEGLERSFLETSQDY